MTLAGLLHRSSAWLLVGAGLAHGVFASRLYNFELSVDALFWVSSGLGLALVGALNLVAWHDEPPPRGLRRVLLVADVVLVLMATLVAIALPEVPPLAVAVAAAVQAIAAVARTPRDAR